MVTVGPCVLRVVRGGRPGERVAVTEGRVSVVMTPGRVVAVRRLLKVEAPRPYRGKGGDGLAERLAEGSSAVAGCGGVAKDGGVEEGGGEPKEEMVRGEVKDGGEEEGGGVLVAVRLGGASMEESEA